MLTFVLERKLHNKTVLGAVKNKKKINEQANCNDPVANKMVFNTQVTK